jgi:hypothetical protein
LVTTRLVPGGIFAVRLFNGLATPEGADQQQAVLRSALTKDGLQHDGAGYTLARYNDPSTKPFFRRNEVLIPLKDFQLW